MPLEHFSRIGGYGNRTPYLQHGGRVGYHYTTGSAHKNSLMLILYQVSAQLLMVILYHVSAQVLMVILYQVSAQVLMVILDHESASMQNMEEKCTPTNYFTYFLSRIHREEDFQFILSGLIKLLNNPLLQVRTYS